MGLPLNMKTALTEQLSSQYRKTGKKEKNTMLNEFIRQTGYNRKYALHLMTHWGKEAFFQVWPPFYITAEVKTKLLLISPATIDRVLRGYAAPNREHS